MAQPQPMRTAPKPLSQTRSLRLLPKHDPLVQLQAKIELKSKDIGRVFRQFDEDKDGFIAPDEFRKGLSNIGFHVDDAQFTQLLKAVDVDGSGQIEYNEFAATLRGADDTSLTIGEREATPPPRKARAAVQRTKQAPRDSGLGMLPKNSILAQLQYKVSLKNKRLGRVFRQFDENKDGVIAPDEFRKGLSNFGFQVDDAQFAQLMKTVDADGSGQIEYNEFAASLLQADDTTLGIGENEVAKTSCKATYAAKSVPKQGSTKTRGLGMLPRDDIMVVLQEKVELKNTRIDRIFRQFDADHDGTIDHGEFRTGLANAFNFSMNDEQFKALVRRVDHDGSGKIDYNEFANTFRATEVGTFSELNKSDWDDTRAAIFERAGQTVSDAGAAPASLHKKTTTAAEDRERQALRESSTRAAAANRARNGSSLKATDGELQTEIEYKAPPRKQLIKAATVTQPFGLYADPVPVPRPSVRRQAQPMTTKENDILSSDARRDDFADSVVRKRTVGAAWGARRPSVDVLTLGTHDAPPPRTSRRASVHQASAASELLRPTVAPEALPFGSSSTLPCTSSTSAQSSRNSSQGFSSSLAEGKAAVKEAPSPGRRMTSPARSRPGRSSSIGALNGGMAVDKPTSRKHHASVTSGNFINGWQ